MGGKLGGECAVISSRPACTMYQAHEPAMEMPSKYGRLLTLSFYVVFSINQTKVSPPSSFPQSPWFCRWPGRISCEVLVVVRGARDTWAAVAGGQVGVEARSGDKTGVM